MSDDSSLQPTGQGSDTTMYRPAAEGGLEAVREPGEDYRQKLRSRRWDAAPLENPEVERTDPKIAVGAVALLSVFTLVVIVLGYASGFWG